MRGRLQQELVTGQGSNAALQSFVIASPILINHLYCRSRILFHLFLLENQQFIVVSGIESGLTEPTISLNPAFLPVRTYAYATFAAHTASPPPPSRTPAGSRASSRCTSIAPRTTSGHGPRAWGAPRTRTHRSIPAPPTPAGASRLR